MTIYAIIFYILGLIILISTAIAVTRRNLVHAVVYLVVSFFGSAMIFYILVSPLLPALEVIIYAGAIMILFLFIIMMMRVEAGEERNLPMRQYLPAMGMCFCYLTTILALFFNTDPAMNLPMKTAAATPATPT